MRWNILSFYTRDSIVSFLPSFNRSSLDSLAESMDCLSSFLQAVSGYLVNLDACNSSVIPLLFFIVPAISRGSSERSLSQETFRALDEKKKNVTPSTRSPLEFGFRERKEIDRQKGTWRKKKSREKRNVTPNIATDAKSLICPVAFFFYR